MTYFLDEDKTNQIEGSNDAEEMSFVFEPGHTRRYHRCFTTNIILNITMLVSFSILILLAPWYSWSHTDMVSQNYFFAEFSLILIRTTVTGPNIEAKY